MKKPFVIGMVVVIVIIVIVLLGRAGQNNQSSVSIPSQSATQSASGEVKSFTMTAKQWQFEPSTITVNRGDQVKLAITSVDVTHGIGLPEFGVSSRLSPGQTTEVEFVADRAGTYSFFCTVSCGVGHGNMRGTLIVK